MTADEFVIEWKDKRDTDDTPAVGIEIFVKTAVIKSK